jgi:hypothetical protein
MGYKALAYTHEQLMELLVKLDEGFLLPVDHEVFEANLLEKVQANLEAFVGKEANEDAEAEGLFLRMKEAEEGLLAEVERAEQAELEIKEIIGKDEEGENAATGLCLRLWNLESFEEKAKIDINALDALIGIPAADGNEAEGLYKVIADCDKAVMDALLLEVNKEMERAVFAEQELNAALLELKNEKDALQLALEDAILRILALEAKNAELEAALNLKATTDNILALDDRLKLVEAFEARIAALETKA